jgi:hypothetical protein
MEYTCRNTIADRQWRMSSSNNNQAPRIPIPKTPRFHDITGLTFQNIEVLWYAGKINAGNQTKSMWWCKCHCGKEFPAIANNLKTGNTSSCGCLKGTHKESGTPEYHAWEAMLARCNNPKCPEFCNYGARGITVCERWSKYEAFKEDMSARPHGMSIDRIDNNSGYGPGNCRWATMKQQQQNKRTNRMIFHNGLNLCIQAWAEKTGIPATTIHNRLNKQWSISRVLATKEAE